MTKYITEMDMEELLEQFKHMPNKSAVARVNDSYLFINIDSVEYDSFDTAKLWLRSDEFGTKITQYVDHSAAKHLYEIADPQGIKWENLPTYEKDKYIRLQKAGIKP